MAKVYFKPDDAEVELPDNTNLQDTCEEYGVPFACTEGVCGTCVIEVHSGMENLSEPTEEEEDFLGEDVQQERLACQCTLKKGRIEVSY